MIKITNLYYVYSAGGPFEKAALVDINLNIEKGRFVGIIGHTGSGKSTLVQVICGLLKPTSGQVLIDGKNIYEDKNKKELRYKVGLVFQYPEHQLFEETVYKDIAFGPKNMNLDEEEIKRRVLYAAKVVGLKERHLEKSPFDLSGGQKRRAAIAGVIAMKPEILLLDEPTAGLDPKGRDEILREIKELHKKENLTVILISHSMEDIAKLADTVIVMNKGKVHMMGSPKEIFAKANELRQIGLNAPSISELCQKLRDDGMPLPPNIITVQDAAEEILKLLGKL